MPRCLTNAIAHNNLLFERVQKVFSPENHSRVLNTGPMFKPTILPTLKTKRFISFVVQSELQIKIFQEIYPNCSYDEADLILFPYYHLLYQKKDDFGD